WNWLLGLVAKVLQGRDVQRRDRVVGIGVEWGTNHHFGAVCFRISDITDAVPEVLIILSGRVRGHDHWTAVLLFRVRSGESRAGLLDVEQAFPRRLLTTVEGTGF